ncbi:hypothetical protein UCRPA7_7224 [Phaeoacremonium minimum UCRPA7]|uniref:Mid2 domain-containing protein n=1 Tax=Phaeoacremonium minimum (strain UCR-PA7) TaxID=1286976 RepID=R8BDA9_PHAM7|nr:hypothetical protein UCRPA7_7224 [Phaeoacremonium minimum UCRPA7]EON97280.1 hypothetical protein UCRPA7_7224 [Phaeoacremonium minimum UCRPA7]
MARLRRPLRAFLVAAICATTSASAIPFRALFERADTCPTDFSSCPDGLPDNFCCPNGQTCNALAGNTTALCCPEGANCDRIQPITCDLSQQDASKSPTNLIKTTALNAALGRCGTNTCCPFGYSCDSDTKCKKDANQNAAPIETTPVSTSTTAVTSLLTATGKPTTTTPTASATVSPDPVSATSEAPQPTTTSSSSGGSSTAAIAGGIAGGLIAAILIAILVCVCIKRKQKQRKEAAAADPLKLNRSTSSFGNIIANPLTAGGPHLKGPISKPIISAGSTMRSDFARRSPGSHRDSSGFGGGGVGIARGSGDTYEEHGASSLPSTPSRTPRTQVRPGVGTAAVPPIRNMAATRREPPETPPPPQQRRDREPSSVSINVFADPTVATPHSGLLTPHRERRLSHQTTFTDMMEQADLGGIRRGEPYVPPSAQSSPARRR